MSSQERKTTTLLVKIFGRVAYPPVSDTTCPFYASDLLILSSQTSCPTCGVLRA